jgi:hypothetical protein
MALRGLEAGLTYRGFYHDLKTGQGHDIGTMSGDEQGAYVLPKLPIFQDWVVVLERWALGEGARLIRVDK